MPINKEQSAESVLSIRYPCKHKPRLSLWVTDPQGFILMCSNRLLSKTCHASEEIFGTTLDLTIHSTILPLVTLDGFFKGGIDYFLDLQTLTIGNDAYLAQKGGGHDGAEAFLWLFCGWGGLSSFSLVH